MFQSLMGSELANSLVTMYFVKARQGGTKRRRL
nr:MAG TPA: hypothetical protein [Caudoviricetes sp.]